MTWGVGGAGPGLSESTGRGGRGEERHGEGVEEGKRKDSNDSS